MLESLRIINYALIDDLTIEFRPGLNIFTGATGAGKTIIVGALGLALGEKTSDEMIRTGADSTVVEALFSIDSPAPIPELAVPAVSRGSSENRGQVIIRREVGRNGRTRAHLNNSFATLQSLRSIGAALADITSQHRQKSLTDPAGHCQILDQYAGIIGEVNEVGRLHRHYYSLKSELDRLVSHQQDLAKERDLLEFQLKEIEAAALEVGEDGGLLKERNELVNAETIRLVCRNSYASLFEQEGSVSEHVRIAIKEFQKATKFSDAAQKLAQRLEELTIALDEIGLQIRDVASRLEFDPGKLEMIEDRLALINKLKRKYGQSIEEVLQYAADARSKVAAFGNVDDRIQNLSTELAGCRVQLSEGAARVSKRRKQAARSLEKEVERHLSDLAMEAAKFEIAFDARINPEGPFAVGSQTLSGNEGGFDIVEFMICPNPGENLKPLALTASGGELSRMLLALCSALAEAYPRGTLVFDEIDSGISGKVAFQVGKKLKKLARNRQVICITHLQQIASQGDAHFRVFKSKSKGRAVTRVKLLEGKQRVEEIARLLSGERVTEAALSGAAELLEEGES